MHIEVLSLFPRYIEGPIRESILGRAMQKGLIKVSTVDIRSFSERKDGRVDDRPYGGGPGMVMMAAPVVSAIRSVKKEFSKVVFLSPRGRLLTPDLAKDLAKSSHLVLVCGHYEGIDERAIEGNVDLEVSIGDYVLTNGCLAALVLIDVVARFIPGVLGHEDAAHLDSFEHGIFDHPQYTVPRVFEGKEVPGVLLSGDHEKIENWRKSQALHMTSQRRPDLIVNTFSKENEVPLGTTAITKAVFQTGRFDEVTSFYRKLTGVSPQIQEGRALFSFSGASLCFMRAETKEKSTEFLFLKVDPSQYQKICSKYKKHAVSSEHEIEGWHGPISEDRLLLSDPDGRVVVVDTHFLNG